jgi:hypothetical protein
MKDAQQEIKSTVTVNTSDIAAKAHEDKEQNRDLEKLAKKRGGEFFVRMFFLSSLFYNREIRTNYWGDKLLLIDVKVSRVTTLRNVYHVS